MGKILKNGQNLELPFDGRNGQVPVGGTNFANRLGGFEDLSETCFETVGLGLGLGLGLATGG